MPEITDRRSRTGDRRTSEYEVHNIGVNRPHRSRANRLLRCDRSVSQRCLSAPTFDHVGGIRTSSVPTCVSCGVRALLEAVQLELSGILDELEEQMLELGSLAGAPTRPRPERERMRRDGIDSLTLGAAPAGDVPSVGQKPHLVELKELRRTIATHCQKHSTLLSAVSAAKVTGNMAVGADCQRDSSSMVCLRLRH
jgi:hypothetical protein